MSPQAARTAPNEHPRRSVGVMPSHRRTCSTSVVVEAARHRARRCYHRLVTPRPSSSSNEQARAVAPAFADGAVDEAHSEASSGQNTRHAPQHAGGRPPTLFSLQQGDAAPPSPSAPQPSYWPPTPQAITIAGSTPPKRKTRDEKTPTLPQSALHGDLAGPHDRGPPPPTPQWSTHLTNIEASFRPRAPARTRHADLHRRQLRQPAAFGRYAPTASEVSVI